MTPRELSLAFLRAYNERDLDTLADLIDDDVAYTAMGGVEAVSKAEVVANYAESFENDFEFELLRSTEEGDAVVVEILGRQRVPPHRVIRANDYHRWRNGKLVEYRAYVDLLPS